MNTLTLYQPWATLLADGHKHDETRHWAAWLWAIGEPLAIHAGARVMTGPLALGEELHEFMRRQYGYSWDTVLPRKAIVAVGRLKTVSRVIYVDPMARVAAVVPAHLPNHLGYNIDTDMFGDYGEGRYIWEMEGVQKVDPPIQILGKRTIWQYPDVDGRLAELVR